MKMLCNLKTRCQVDPIQRRSRLSLANVLSLDTLEEPELVGETEILSKDLVLEIILYEKRDSSTSIKFSCLCFMALGFSLLELMFMCMCVTSTSHPLPLEEYDMLTKDHSLSMGQLTGHSRI